MRNRASPRRASGRIRPLHRSMAVAVLLCACVAAPARALTNVSGGIVTDTTWLAAESPYVCVTNVLVLPGVTLTIQPGVEVRIRTASRLLVNGNLHAVGTQEQPIRFTRDPEQPAPYGGQLIFAGVSPAQLSTGLLAHCEFDLLSATGSGSYGACLGSRDTALNVSRCTFRDLAGTSIRLRASRVQFVNNLIDNTGEVINLVACAGLIASNLVSQVVGYADGIDIDLAWAGPGDPNIVIEYNLLDGGPDPNADGIDFGTASNVVFRHNIIRNFGDKGLSIGEGSTHLVGYNNLISGCNVGIAIKDSSTPELHNTTVVNCNYGIWSYRKYLPYGGGQGSVGNTIIWNCRTNILLQNASTTAFYACNTEGATPWPGPGNIATNPAFVNAAASNFQLAAASPCINQGTNQAWKSLATDLAGFPRILGGTVDIGAYEFVPDDYDGDGDGMPDTWEMAYFGTHARNGEDDLDTDGMPDAEEYEAGTDPTNRLEVLRASAIASAGTFAEIAWPTVTGRFYSLFWSTNLVPVPTWWPDPLCVDVPGAGGPLSVTNTPSTDAPHYYRIGVRRNTN